MVIGDKNSFATHEKSSSIRSLNILIITIILIIITLTIVLVSNNTSFIEKKLFNIIAKASGYELRYSNIYEDLASDNIEQGNYIQLTDKENGIYILFRYDEDIKINRTDDRFYNIKKKLEDIKELQSNNIILSNIDQEFNNIHIESVSGDSKNVGGSYKITKIGSINNDNNRIEFKSNLLSSVGIGNLDNEDNIKKADNVKDWFNYKNSKSYMLRKMKDICERKTEYSNISRVIYGDEILEDFNKFSTHSVIITKQLKKFSFKRNVDNSTEKTNGIILSCCPNSKDVIEKLNRTLRLLNFILNLESTIFL